MFNCEIWLFSWYFAQFCTSYMSKYGYVEMFQKVPSTSRYRESTVPYLQHQVSSRGISVIIRCCSTQRLLKLVNDGHI